MVYQTNFIIWSFPLKSFSYAIHAFFNANWASCHDDRKSTNGFAIYLGSNLISWFARKQNTVARPLIESEY